MTTHCLLGFLGFGLLHLLLIPFIIGFGLLMTVFWVWMLVECARRISKGDGNQVGWLIVIALTHFLGAAIYFLFGRRTA
jgi:hypothetical protein